MQSSNCLSMRSTSLWHLALIAETVPPLLNVRCTEYKSKASPSILLIRLAINAHYQPIKQPITTHLFLNDIIVKEKRKKDVTDEFVWNYKALALN